jgi:hypothetical protein
VSGVTDATDATGTTGTSGTEPGAGGGTEGGTGGGTEGAAPYTDTARARLLTAYEACELADLARAFVPVGEGELNSDGCVRSPGALLSDAAAVLEAARRFFAAAVVYERVGGADWQLVGDVLKVPARAARSRFAGHEARFRGRLSCPEETGPAATGDEASRLRTYMAREPLEAALDLDQWVLDHADGDAAPGPAPVSGGLVRSNP